MDGLPAFVLACLALAGSPGPATLSLAATGAAFGARHGLAYMAGILAGMVGVMGIVVTGLAGAVLALPGVAPAVMTAAAAYFVWLAMRIATAPPLTEDSDARSRPTFVGGMLLSLLNPKGYAAVSALYSGFVLVQGEIEADAAAKIVVMIAITALVNVAWLTAGTGLTRIFRAPRSNRAINILFATTLIASVAFALWV
jgi:threonine/homoserine/homoserine lactone efflux protein